MRMSGMDKVQIKVNPGNIRLNPDSRHNLLTALSVHGFFRHLPLCAGIGRCGNCRIRFVSPPPRPTFKDKETLTPGELEEGWRLACEHGPEPGQEIDVPSGRPVFNFSLVSREAPLSLVVDVGTTSVKWAFDHGKGKTSFGSAPNPQSATGGEVMSRMQFALDGLERAAAQKEALSGLIRDILALVQTAPPLTVLTGNPAMICLAFGLDCTTLARAPYSLPLKGNAWYDLGEGLPQVYVPPLVSPFLGADIVCGLLATGSLEHEKPWLFADFGTNAEMILGTENGCFGTSVAMGPALEGCGLRFGAVAGEKGACTQIVMDKNGIYPRGGETCRRLTGTAYLDIVRRLKGLGIIKESGGFAPDNGSPLAQRVFERLKENRLYVTEDIFLDPADIEELLKVKAAFTLGLEGLLSRAGLKASELDKIYVAGALGEKLSRGVLISLGFLPPWSEDKIEFCGNTSLAGGIGMAKDLDASRLQAEEIRKSVHTVDLTRNGLYTGSDFARHMRFEFV